MKLNTILPDLLYVRGRSDLLPKEQKLATLREKDIWLIVNLWYKWDDDLLDEPGLAYFNVPIPDGRLKPQRIAELQRWADFIAERLRKGLPVLIQCHAGRNRSGLLAAMVVSRYKGITDSEALEYVRQMRPDAVDNAHFERYLEGGPLA